MAGGTQKYVIGSLIIFILISSVVYIYFFDKVKIHIGKDDTKYYVNATGKFELSATEINKMYQGSSLKYRKASLIAIDTVIDNISKEVIVTRTTPYYFGGIVKDIYVFDGSSKNVESFPKEHYVDVINASGYIYQYEARDLIYSGATIKDVSSPLYFGNNIKIEWERVNYWSTLYQSGVLKLRFKPKSDYERYSIRIFDPPPTQQFVSPTPANASTYYADGIYVNVSNSTGTNLPTDTFTVVDFDRDLQLWLRFDDVNGSGDAIDSSSFKYNASVQTSAFINGSGRWGNASNFDGNGGIVVLQNRTNGTNNLNFGANVGFTISFWVNGDQNATTRRIFQKVGPNGYNLLYSSTTLTRFRVTEGGVNINVNFAGNTMTRTWHHLAMGRNSTDAYFYFDGVANVTAADTTLSALDSLSGLEIGGDQLDTALTLNGSIDEFMVWNRSLDYFEIRTLYNSSVNKYGHNFTNLSYENHTFRAYTVAANGTNASEERIVYLQAPASAPASFSGSEYNVTLNWSSYIGGSGQDSFREVIVLNDGSILSVGNFNLTNQTTILTNATFFGPTRNASVLVTKWRSNGSVIWQTLVGGSGTERGYGMDTDAEGNIYVAGQTNSSDFPTTAGVINETRLDGGGCLGAGHGCNLNAYVFKLNPHGNVLNYSTYIGGTGIDGARGGLAVSPDGFAYILGFTDSTDLPRAVNAYQGGFNDAFVTKINKNATRVEWSRYFGAPNDTSAQAEVTVGGKVDSQGDIYLHILVGDNGVNTTSTYPVNQSFYGGGNRDQFFVKLSQNGLTQYYATYSGGSGGDFGEHRIAIDKEGNAYFAAESDSTNYPLTRNANQTTNSGVGDCVLVRLNSTGSPTYSTYFGGTLNEVCTGPAVLFDGTMMTAGQTASTNLPVLRPLNSTSNGGTDLYVAVWNVTGSLMFSTYFGGTGDDQGRFMSINPLNGDVLAITDSDSSDFPTTPGVYDTTFDGEEDGTLTVFSNKMFADREGTAPVVTLVTPENRTTISRVDYFNINLTSNEVSNITLNDTRWTLSQVSNGVTFGFSNNTAIGEGRQDIKVYANDSFGNNGSINIQFFKDTVSPVITLLNPTNRSTLLFIDYYNLNFSVNEVSNITLNDSRFTLNVNTNGVSFNFTNNTLLANGGYDIKVYVNDSGNNNGSININFVKNVSSCGTLSSSTSLNNDVISGGTCFTIGASHITLDCNGFNITYSTNSSNSQFGVQLNGTYSNITVRDCEIMDGSTSGGIQQDGIRIEGSRNNTLINNTILIQSGTSVAIRLVSTNETNVENNSIRVFGSSGYGILLVTRSDRNRFFNNNITSFLANGVGIFLSNTQNSFNYIENNKINANASAIQLDDANQTYIINNNLTATSIFSIEDNTGIGETNFLIYNDSFVDLRWHNNGSGSFYSNLTINGSIGLGLNLFFANNTFALNFSAFNQPARWSRINSTANITFNGLSFSGVNELRRVDNFTTDRDVIMGVGYNCSGTGVLCQIQSYSGGILQFNTTGFSSFTANLTIIVATDTTPPIVTLLYPTNRTSLFVVDYYNLNFSTNEVSNITLNDTRWDLNVASGGVSFNFTNNTPLANGNYDIKVYANDSSGNNGSININFIKNVSSCGTLTSSTRLNNDVYGTTDCFIINASHITLDCKSYNISFSTNSSANNNDGIDFQSNAVNNVTIMNCEIQNMANAGANQQGIRISHSNNNTIINNTIRSSTVTTNSRQIFIQNGTQNIVLNNTLKAYTSNSHGFTLSTSSSHNLLRGNNFTAYEAVTGVLMQTGNNDNNYIENNHFGFLFDSNYFVFRLTSANHTYLINNNVSIHGRWAILDETPEMDVNYLIFNSSDFDIRWQDNGAGSFYRNLTYNGSLGLGINVFGGNNSVSLNWTAQGNGGSTRINSTANITFRGLSFGSINQLRRVENITINSGDILNAGINCTSTAGLPCQIQSYSGGVLQFNTTGFSSFTANFSDVAAPADTCTAPSSGNWAITCSDRCELSTNQNVPGNVTMIGPGNISLAANLTFINSNQFIYIGSQCTFDIRQGASIR